MPTTTTLVYPPKFPCSSPPKLWLAAHPLSSDRDCLTLARCASSFSLASLVSAIRLARATSVSSFWRLMSLLVVCSTPSTITRRAAEFWHCLSVSLMFRCEESSHSSWVVDLSRKHILYQWYTLQKSAPSRHHFLAPLYGAGFSYHIRPALRIG